MGVGEEGKGGVYVDFSSCFSCLSILMDAGLELNHANCSVLCVIDY